MNKLGKIGLKNKPTVNTRNVMLDTTIGRSAMVWPTNHPRVHLNSAPYVITSEIQEIIVITRNTRYVWKKPIEQKQEVEANVAENNIPKLEFQPA